MKMLKNEDMKRRFVRGEWLKMSQTVTYKKALNCTNGTQMGNTTLNPDENGKMKSERQTPY
jgi:hypothetical protein